MINRYYGWYSDSGHPEVVSFQFPYDLDNWYQVRKKPIMISEYGAGTIDGFHKDPSTMFTEDHHQLVLVWPARPTPSPILYANLSIQNRSRGGGWF